jgi:hypothetical protein
MQCSALSHGQKRQGVQQKSASSWQATACLITLMCCSRNAHADRHASPSSEAGLTERGATQQSKQQLCTLCLLPLYSITVPLMLFDMLLFVFRCAVHVHGQSSMAMPQLPFRSHGLGSDGYLRSRMVGVRSRR